MPTATAADLATRLREALGRRCVVAAVGNPLRGDDGAAALLLGGWRAACQAALLDTEEVPESFAGQIAALKPEVVLLVDAVDLGGGARARWPC